MDYTWKIYNLTRTTSDDVVYEVIYGCIATTSSYTSSYTHRQASTLEITGSSSDPDFIPYEDLTEDIVISWVTGSIDPLAFKTEVSASLALQINHQNNITKETSVPW